VGKPEILKFAKFKTYLKIFCILLSLIWIAGCIFGELLLDEHWLGYEVFGFYYNLTEESHDFLSDNLWFSSKWDAGIVGFLSIWFPFFLISMMSADNRTLEKLRSINFKKHLKIFCVYLSVVCIAGIIFGEILDDENGYVYKVFGFYYNLNGVGDLWFSSKWELGITVIVLWLAYFLIRISIISDDNFFSKLDGKNKTYYKGEQKKELETSQLESVVNENQKPVSKYELQQEDEKTLFKGKPFTEEYISYHPNDSKKSEHFHKDGKKILAKEWNDDGSLKFEVKYADGKKEIDGNRAECLKDGNSFLKVQFKDGKKQSEENFIDESLNGSSTQWHPNGKKKVEKTYKNGIENGIRKEWNEDGKKTFQENFVDGNEE
jgi:antitoxin component YwqK of YwqJK toxin-antitoxin module